MLLITTPSAYPLCSADQATATRANRGGRGREHRPSTSLGCSQPRGAPRPTQGQHPQENPQGDVRRGVEVGRHLSQERQERWSPMAPDTHSCTALCENFAVRSSQRTEGRDHLAVDFHHQLVSIHSFTNGNGRHARLRMMARNSGMSTANIQPGRTVTDIH